MAARHPPLSPRGRHTAPALPAAAPSSSTPSHVVRADGDRNGAAHTALPPPVARLDRREDVPPAPLLFTDLGHGGRIGEARVDERVREPPFAEQCAEEERDVDRRGRGEGTGGGLRGDSLASDARIVDRAGRGRHRGRAQRRGVSRRVVRCGLVLSGSRWGMERGRKRALGAGKSIQSVSLPSVYATTVAASVTAGDTTVGAATRLHYAGGLIAADTLDPPVRRWTRQRATKGINCGWAQLSVPARLMLGTTPGVMYDSSDHVERTNLARVTRTRSVVTGSLVVSFPRHGSVVSPIHCDNRLGAEERVDGNGPQQTSVVAAENDISARFQVRKTTFRKSRGGSTKTIESPLDYTLIFISILGWHLYPSTTKSSSRNPSMLPISSLLLLNLNSGKAYGTRLTCSSSGSTWSM